MIHSVTSVFLATLLIVGNLWVPVYTHTCKLFDRSEISFFDARFCCEDDTSEAETLSDLGCCSLDFKTIKSIDHSDSPTIYKVFSPDFVHPEFFSFGSQLVKVSFYSTIEARPPPVGLFNRTLLSFIQVFRL